MAGYLVIDLEATCSNAGEIPPEQMEIIEVGALMVSADFLTPVAEFQSFVPPTTNTSRWLPTSRSTFVTRRIRSSAGPTRTPTACFASTSRKASTYLATRKLN
jgi:hypothetical protein